MQRGEVRDPVKVAAFSLLSCGFYGFYWLYQVCEEINRGLGRQQLEFVKWFVISLVTCGIGGIYFLWMFCNALVDLKRTWGLQPKFDAPVALLIWLVFAPGAMFLMQQELNETWQSGTPGGAGGYGTGPVL